MNKMKTKHFALAVLALSLAACNNENEILNNDGPVAAQFTADIYKAVSTRVNSEGTGFTDKDCIGINSEDITNVPYVRENGQFGPKGTTIYFNDTETKTFSAYYPYREDSELQNGIVSVNTDQYGQGPEIDFLFASGATGSTSSPTVSFTGEHAFKHCMSLVKFNFLEGEGVDFSEKILKHCMLNGLKTVGTFNTTTGETALTVDYPSPITMWFDDGATTSQLFIFPQTLDFTTPLNLSVVYNGVEYTTTLPKPSTSKLDAGYAYTYNITLNNKGITVEEPEITPWEPGDSNDASAEL